MIGVKKCILVYNVGNLIVPMINPVILKKEKLYETEESCKVDITLSDGDILNIGGGIEVVATPGHMPGNISLYHIDA